jgi:hypothetical protein
MKHDKAITKAIIYELANWLTIDKPFSKEQLARLQEEQYYLPLISLAHNFWLIGALVQQLKNKKVWKNLPEELVSYLAEIEMIYFLRSEKMIKEAHYSCGILKNKNIEIVMLKGIAALFNDSYKVISERYMVDIDLLVKEENALDSYSALQNEGYFEQPGEFDIQVPNHHHFPALIRNDGCCYIEIHRNALKNSINKVLRTQEIWQECITLPIGNNIVVNQPSPTHQLILAIAHSELSDNNYGNRVFELKQIHNAYIIAHFYYEEIDWDKVKHHFLRVQLLYVLENMMFSIYQIYDFFTPLTKKIDIRSQNHLAESIDRYITCQGEQTLRERVKMIFEGYNYLSILYLYGGSGYFPVFIGRLKHFVRHCKILLKSLSKSIKRIK